MTVTTDSDLYVRGAATLFASWEEYARGSAGAALKRLDGVSAAVFPSGPERAVYNNALLDRDLGRPSAPRPSTRWRRPTARLASTATPRLDGRILEYAPRP